MHQAFGWPRIISFNIYFKLEISASLIFWFQHFVLLQLTLAIMNFGSFVQNAINEYMVTLAVTDEYKVNNVYKGQLFRLVINVQFSKIFSRFKISAIIRDENVFCSILFGL